MGDFNVLMSVTSAMLLLLLQGSQLVTSRPPGSAEAPEISGITKDYYVLQNILGQHLGGTSTEKSRVIDLLLQLLEEIDLPTLCEVIVNDTKASKHAFSRVPIKYTDIDVDLLNSLDSQMTLENSNNEVTPQPPSKMAVDADKTTSAESHEQMTIKYNDEESNASQNGAEDTNHTRASYKSHTTELRNGDWISSQEGQNIKDDSFNNVNDPEILSSSVLSSEDSKEIINNDLSGQDLLRDGHIIYSSLLKDKTTPVNEEGSLEKSIGDLKQMYLRFQNKQDVEDNEVLLGYTNDINNKNILVKQIDVEKPRAQLFSESLVLGDWMNKNRFDRNFLTSYTDNEAEIKAIDTPGFENNMVSMDVWRDNVKSDYKTVFNPTKQQQQKYARGYLDSQDIVRQMFTPELTTPPSTFSTYNPTDATFSTTASENQHHIGYMEELRSTLMAKKANKNIPAVDKDTDTSYKYGMASIELFPQVNTKSTNVESENAIIDSDSNEATVDKQQIKLLADYSIIQEITNNNDMNKIESNSFAQEKTNSIVASHVIPESSTADKSDELGEEGVTVDFRTQTPEQSYIATTPTSYLATEPQVQPLLLENDNKTYYASSTPISQNTNEMVTQATAIFSTTVDTEILTGNYGMTQPTASTVEEQPVTETTVQSIRNFGFQQHTPASNLPQWAQNLNTNSSDRTHGLNVVREETELANLNESFLLNNDQVKGGNTTAFPDSQTAQSSVTYPENASTTADYPQMEAHMKAAMPSAISSSFVAAINVTQNRVNGDNATKAWGTYNDVMQAGVGNSGVAQARVTSSFIAQAGVSNSEVTQDMVTNSDAMQTGVNHSGVTQTEVTNNDVTQNGVINSTVTQAEVTNSNVTQTEVINNEVTQSVVTNNDVTQTGVSNNTVTQAGVTNSDIRQTEVRNNEVTQSEVTNSGVTQTGISNNTVTQAGVTNSDVTETEVSNNELTQSEVTNNDVTQTGVSNNTVTQAEVTNSDVTQTEVINNEVTQSVVTNNDVTQTGVSNNTVTQAGVTNSDITQTEVRNNEITQSEVTNSGVTQTGISNNTVTQAGVTNSDVTETEVSNNELIQSEVTNNDVTQTGVSNNTVTQAGVTNSDVTQTEVSNNELIQSEVTNSGVTQTGISNNTVTQAWITNSDVTQTEVSNNEVTQSEVTNSGVTQTGISNNTVTQAGVTNSDVTETEDNNNEVTQAGVTNSDVIQIGTNNNEVTKANVTNNNVDHNAAANNQTNPMDFTNIVTQQSSEFDVTTDQIQHTSPVTTSQASDLLSTQTTNTTKDVSEDVGASDVTTSITGDSTLYTTNSIAIVNVESALQEEEIQSKTMSIVNVKDSFNNSESDIGDLSLNLKNHTSISLSAYSNILGEETSQNRLLVPAKSTESSIQEEANNVSAAAVYKAGKRVALNMTTESDVTTINNTEDNISDSAKVTSLFTSTHPPVTTSPVSNILEPELEINSLVMEVNDSLSIVNVSNNVLSSQNVMSMSLENSTFVQVLNESLGSENTATEAINTTAESINTTVESINTTAEAINITVESINTIAEAVNTTAEAINTTAEAINTTVESINTTVEAINTTVEAINTTVEAINTTAEAINTTVESINTTVESINTAAEAINKTAEAINTTAEATNTTAESINTTAEAINTAAEDINTTAEAINTAAEAINTAADAINTTAEAINTAAEAINTTVESINTTVEAINTTVESINTTVEAINTTAEAINTTVESINTTVESINTAAEAINKTAEAINTTAEATNTTAESINTTAEAINTAAEDINTTAEAINTAAEAINTAADAINTTAEAINTAAEAINTTAEAINTTVEAINTTAESINTTAEAINTTVEAINTTAESINTTAESINTTAESINTTAEAINTAAEDINTTAEAINTAAEDINTAAEAINTTVNTAAEAINTRIVTPTAFNSEFSASTQTNITGLDVNTNIITTTENITVDSNENNFPVAPKFVLEKKANFDTFIKPTVIDYKSNGMIGSVLELSLEQQSSETSSEEATPRTSSVTAQNDTQVTDASGTNYEVTEIVNFTDTESNTRSSTSQATISFLAMSDNESETENEDVDVMETVTLGPPLNTDSLSRVLRGNITTDNLKMISAKIAETKANLSRINMGLLKPLQVRIPYEGRTSETPINAETSSITQDRNTSQAMTEVTEQQAAYTPESTSTVSTGVDNDTTVTFVITTAVNPIEYTTTESTTSIPTVTDTSSSREVNTAASILPISSAKTISTTITVPFDMIDETPTPSSTSSNYNQDDLKDFTENMLDGHSGTFEYSNIPNSESLSGVDETQVSSTSVPKSGNWAKVYDYPYLPLKGKYPNRPSNHPYMSQLTDHIDMQKLRTNPVLDSWKVYNIAIGKSKTKVNNQGTIDQPIAPEIHLYSNHRYIPAPAENLLRNYLWQARPWPKDALHNLGQDSTYNSMLASKPELYQNQHMDMRKVVNYQTKTLSKVDNFQDQLKKIGNANIWGNRFNQGYYGRVFDDHSNELNTDDSTTWPAIHSREMVNFDKLADNIKYFKGYSPVEGIKNKYNNWNGNLGIQSSRSFDLNQRYRDLMKTFPLNRNPELKEKHSNVEPDQAGSQPEYSGTRRGDSSRNVAPTETAAVPEAQVTGSWTTDPQTYYNGVPAPEDYTCPGLFGYHKDPKNCQAFFICSWGMAHRVVCPPGTLYNSKEAVCDWAVNIRCTVTPDNSKSPSV